MNRQSEIHSQISGLEGRENLTDAEKTQLAALNREWNANKREITLLNQEREAAKNAKPMDVNAQMREIVKAVREGKLNGDFLLKRTATSTITSGIIQPGEKTNMESAGIPVTIQELIKPLEAELIYGKIGLKVQTGVRGKIQWPVLDNSVEVSVGEELDEVDTKVLASVAPSTNVCWLCPLRQSRLASLVRSYRTSRASSSPVQRRPTPR